MMGNAGLDELRHRFPWVTRRDLGVVFREVHEVLSVRHGRAGGKPFLDVSTQEPNCLLAESARRRELALRAQAVDCRDREPQEGRKFSATNH
jgi:hypothetical protein